MMSRFSQNNNFDENRGSSMAKPSGHTPVLSNEVIKYLDPRPGQKFIDATINGGGHAMAILNKILSTPTGSSGPEGKILGTELDKGIYERSLSVFGKDSYKNNVVIVNESYVNIFEIASRENFLNADGILFDLGISSWHIEESGKGFSFMREEPLDMRFHGSGPTASDILNNYSQKNLEYIIREFGGESFAKSIAGGIVKRRKAKDFENTFELVGVIKDSVPFWYRMRRIHPATKTFQAIRIEVNQEIKNIEKGLDSGIRVVRSGGKIAVISFHSLEDKIIKNKFRNWQKEGKGVIMTKKPVKPDFQEIKENIRARSAKLRVFEIKSLTSIL